MVIVKGENDQENIGRQDESRKGREEDGGKLIMIVCAENGGQVGREMKQEGESIAKLGTRNRQYIHTLNMHCSYDHFRVITDQRRKL